MSYIDNVTMTGSSSSSPPLRDVTSASKNNGVAHSTDSQSAPPAIHRAIEYVEKIYTGTSFSCIKEWAEDAKISINQIEKVDFKYVRSSNGKSILLSVWEFDHKEDVGIEEYWALPLRFKIDYLAQGLLKSAVISARIATFLHSEMSHFGKMQEDQRAVFHLGGDFRSSC